MEQEILKKLGTKIRKIREQKSISRDELSKFSKLHRNYISDVERGSRNISIKSLEKISKALKVDLKDLFTNEEEL